MSLSIVHSTCRQFISMVYYFRALEQLDFGRLSTAIKITGFPIIQLLTNELFVRSIISITTIHHKNQSLFTKPGSHTWHTMDIDESPFNLTQHHNKQCIFSLLVLHREWKHTIYPGKSLGGSHGPTESLKPHTVSCWSDPRPVPSGPCDMEHASRLYGWDLVEMAGWLTVQDRL